MERAAEQAGWPPPPRLAMVALGDEDPLQVVHRMRVGTIGASSEAGGVLPCRIRTARAAAARGGAAPPARRSGANGPVGARARVGVAAGDGWSLHAAGRLGDGALARADEHLLDLG